EPLRDRGLSQTRQKRQALRDGCDRSARAEGELSRERAPPENSGEDDGDTATNNDREYLEQHPVQSSAEWAVVYGRPPESLGGRAEASGRPDREPQRLSGPDRDVCALEHDASLGRAALGPLDDRKRLASQGRFIHLESTRAQDPCVGCDTFAGS